MHDLLALGDLRHGERDARGPGADDELCALGVDRFFRAAGRRAGLGAAVARDVPDRPAEDLHAALLERHPHAAVVERPDVGKGAGLIPQPEDYDLLRLRAQDRGKAQTRAGGRQPSGFQDVSSPEIAPSSPPRKPYSLDYYREI